MEQLPFLMESMVCKLKLKLFGYKRINSIFQELHSLIKWIGFIFNIRTGATLDYVIKDIEKKTKCKCFTIINADR